MTRILSAIPLTQSGPPIVMIYDIHALQERFYFEDSILPSLHSAIPLFKSFFLSSFLENSLSSLRSSASDYPLLSPSFVRLNNNNDNNNDNNDNDNNSLFFFNFNLLFHYFII